jgi:hypothetical protein
MIRTVLFSTCAIALISTSTAEAGPFQPSQVPATADVVIHVDVEAFMRSRLHTIFKKEIADAVKQLDLALAGQKLPITAADLMSISGLTFWAEGTDPDRGAMIASGVKAKRLLRAVTKLPNFRVARHGGYVLSRVEVDGDDTFIGATSNVVVISDNKNAVAKTLDAITRKTKSLAGSKTAQRLSQAGGMLVAGAFGNAVAQKIRKQADSPMFKDIELERGAVFAKESGRSLAIRAVLEHATAAGASKLVALGQAGLTMLSMGGAGDPEIAALAKNINLSASGKTATLDLRVPYRLLDKLRKGNVTW